MILLWLMFFFQQYGISNYIKNGFNSRWYVIGNINQFPISKKNQPADLLTAVFIAVPGHGAFIVGNNIIYPQG